MTSRRLVALISALVLFVTACGGGTTASSDAGADETAAGDAATDVATGPDLAVLGQGSLEGKDVVVWFWAEW